MAFESMPARLAAVVDSQCVRRLALAKTRAFAAQPRMTVRRLTRSSDRPTDTQPNTRAKLSVAVPESSSRAVPGGAGSVEIPPTLFTGRPGANVLSRQIGTGKCRASHGLPAIPTGQRASGDCGQILFAMCKICKIGRVSHATRPAVRRQFLGIRNYVTRFLASTSGTR